MLDMVLRGRVVVERGVPGVAVGELGVVLGQRIVRLGVVPGGFAVMARCALVVVGRGGVVIRGAEIVGGLLRRSSDSARCCSTGARAWRRVRLQGPRR